MGGRCLIVFAKSPESERVKSRLAADLGGETARRLYRHFVEDTLASLDRIGGDHRLKICFHPPGHRDVMEKWLGRDRCYEPQRGKDLGERMRHAFEDCFSEGFETAMLVGCDIPDLPAGVLRTGFSALASSDAVIGPSRDGGYYLIGFQSGSFAPEAFSGVSWGTDGVMDKTRAILDARGLKVTLLPLWRDIDTYQDLLAMVERNRDSAFAGSGTVRCVLSMGSAPPQRCGRPSST